MLRRDRPVAAFVVMMLLIVAAIVFGTLGVLDYQSERARLREQLRSDLRLLADQLATSLSLPMWNFDEPQLKSVADGVMDDRDVYGVVITMGDVANPKGARRYQRLRDDHWRVVADDSDNGVAVPLENLLAEEREVVVAAKDGKVAGAAIKVGTVRVFMTRRFIEEELWRHLWHEVVIFVASGAVLSASLYFLLWRTMLHPLNIIDQYAREVSISGEATTISRRQGGKPFRGELERVCHSIEKMVGLLESRLAETRSSERQFRTFIEQAPVPIILVPSPDGTPIYFNPAFTRAFGYSRQDIARPEDWWPLIYPDPEYRAVRRAAWEAKVAAVKETGGFQDADEAEMHTRSGGIRFAQVRLTMVGGYRMSFVNDLTERRQAETALRLTQYAVDHNPVMIYRIDMEGRFEYANDAACSRFGYTPAEILNRHIWDIARTLSAAQWPARATEFREQGGSSLESVYSNRTGVSFPVEVRIQYVHFSGVQSFFVFAYDITDRKAAQEAEHAYTRRIQKLATALTRAEERQRRELAAILHDEVGQNLFAATTQLLTIRNRSEDSRAEVEKALMLLDQVTRDTRDLTFELCPPVLYQLGLMPALQRLAEQFAARHGVTCTVTGNTDGPADLNTRGLAYQAVRELLNNTAKHSQAKNVTISASDLDGHVRIEVADDGIGFDLAEMRPGVGGFGLFHLRERVELLGGSVAIDAAINRGCRVQLILPLNVSQVTE